MHAHGTQGRPGVAATLQAAAKRPKTMAAAADVPDGPRPNLRSLPAWGISLEQGRNNAGKKNGKWYINFSATVWNAGDVAAAGRRLPPPRQPS